VENTITRILRDFVALKPTISSIGEAQALRGEVEANISKVKIELTQLVNTTMERMQAEAERRAEAMLQKLTQMFRLALRNHVDRVAPVIDTEVALGRSMRLSGSQGQNQTTGATQPS
jgi:metal-dependent amidase/aminoacylase/carboxypeptidase family protein